MKRPRSDGRDTSSTTGGSGNASSEEAAAAAAAAAADQATQRPPTINELRRANAQRWEEVVRLREMLLVRQRRRRRQQDDGATSTTSSSGGTSISATQQSSSASGPAQNEGSAISSSAAMGGDSDSNLRQMDALDRRLAAYRSELALLLPPSSSDGTAAGAAAAASTGTASTGTATATANEQQQQQQQQQQHERNVRSILSHRAMINNARLHHSRIFGNEIVETYDGLVQVNAHLDRTIGQQQQQQQQQQQNEAGHQHEISSNGASLAVNEGGAAMSLHERIVEAEGRVEEHRLVHAALVDMLERRGQGMNDATSEGSNGGTGSVVSEGNRATQEHQQVATASANRDNDVRSVAENEAGALRSNLTYFAQQFDAHLDRMERVAATSVLEAREGDVLSDEEDELVDIGSNSNVQSTSTSMSSQQQPFLTSLFTNLSRRLVSNRDDPYLSVEAVIGASGSNSSRSSSRNRRIERRRRIIDHLLSSGVFICHPDNSDLIRFIDYLE